MRISNPTRKTIFYNADNGEYCKDWHTLIQSVDVRQASLENHISNCHHYSPHPSIYNPVIKGVYPIPPKSVWDFNLTVGSPLAASSQERIEYSNNTITTQDFLRIIQKYFRRLKIKKVAVELSGGLDTSLIISLLKEAGIEPSLIGLESERYEFRTERKIQNIYLNSVSEGVLLNYENALPFANLLDMPPHALPNKASLFYYGHKVVASQARKYGINTVLNGIGIEPFLVEPILELDNQYLFRTAMEDAWPNEFVFSEYNCTYVNVATLRLIYCLLCNLRRGEKIDIQKLWARKFFSEMLPAELTKYSYKSAFDGIFQAGINKEIDAIKEVLLAAYQYTKNPELEPKRLTSQLKRASDLTHNENIKALGKLSFACWIYSLLAAKIIS